MKRRDTIVIRVPQRGDGEGLAESWLDVGRYYTDLNPALFQIPKHDGLADFIEQELLQANAETIIVRVAEVRGLVVGAILGAYHAPLATANYNFVKDVSLPRLVIDLLFVHSGYWRQGVGRALLEAAEKWGQEKGAELVLLDTYSRSPVSVVFYEEGMEYHRKGIIFRKTLNEDG